MSAAEFLATLEAAGVRLSLAGDDLHYQTRQGVGITGYQDRIRANKPALVRELIQREIIATVDTEPANFNRPRFLVLWVRW